MSVNFKATVSCIYLFQINYLPPQFCSPAYLIADVSHYLRSKSFFFPCASCIVHQKASA